MGQPLFPSLYQINTRVFLREIADQTGKPATLDQVSDEYLFSAIKNGGAAVGKNAAMPAWKSRLADQEIWDLVGFVRTLARR